jgi:RNA polymerase sigma-70 factor (ECF subfamily)
VTTASDPSVAADRITDREDKDLLERLRRNDRGAMAALYDRYGRIAFGLAYRIVGAPEEAEDVVQESFLSLWRQAGQLDPARGMVRSYLLTIVHRRAIDAVRRRSSRAELGLEEAGEVAANVTDPADVASAAADRDAVQRGLRELSPDLRQAIELTYFGGLTAAELASRVGIPLGTAKSRLRLALERMRRTLAEPGTA